MNMKNFTKTSFLLMLFCVFSSYSIAQTSSNTNKTPLAPENTAILIRGAELKKGIPWFSTNALECLFGVYSFDKSTIRIYYTEQILSPSPNTFKSAKIAQIPIQMYESSDADVYWYSVKNYSLLLAFEKNFQKKESFFTSFLSRFTYFLSFSKSMAEISFPANLIVK